jgi:hypothetical protein
MAKQSRKHSALGNSWIAAPAFGLLAMTCGLSGKAAAVARRRENFGAPLPENQNLCYKSSHGRYRTASDRPGHKAMRFMHFSGGCLRRGIFLFGFAVLIEKA